MIFQPIPVDGYEWINCVDEADYEVFTCFDGSPRGGSWKPIRVKRVPADEHQTAKQSDFPWLGAHALVMRPRAVTGLAQLLEPHGEILPLATDADVGLFVLNVLHIIDALDEGRSEILRFPSTNRIMRVTRPAFLDARVGGVDVFRLPHRASATYLSQRVVDTVRDLKLKGLEFVPVWQPHVAR